MNQPEKMTLKGTLEQRETAKRNKRTISQTFAIPGRMVLLFALVLSPWAFASVHHWAQQWVSIALLIGLGFWWFETAMNSRQSQVMPYIMFFVLAGIAIGLMQVIPLPESLADLLLGRQREIYQDFSGDTNPAFRISLNREGTWDQIRLLTIALTGLLLGCRYFRTTADLVFLLSVCTINGVLLSFVGILQLLTKSPKILWFYEFEMGMPFGPFINRNNGAGFLVMCFACCIGLMPIVLSKRKTKGPPPMVSKEMPIWRQFYFFILYFIAELTATKIAVILSAVLIASGVVSSLSRGGVLALLVGGIFTIVTYGMARKPRHMGLVFLPLVSLVILLTGWIGFSDQLMSRFNQVDLADLSTDGRIQHWKDTFPAITDMGPLGSGLGSYRGVHRLYSTHQETSLFEFAENNFFQSAVEAGWIGLAVFVLAWLMALRYALLLIYRGQSSTSVGVGTFGVFLVASAATTSMFDFGLYATANMLQMSVLTGFLAYHSHSLAARLKSKNWLGREFPNYIIQVMLLVLFAGLTVVTLNLYRRSRLDTAMVPSSDKFHFAEMDLTETDRRIDSLEPQIRKCPTIKSINYLAELWLHRTRVAFMESIKSEDEFRNASLLYNEKEKQELLENVWNMTSLQRIQENAYRLKNDVSSYQATLFLNSPFIRENLPLAANYFAYSRRISPLQPVVQLRLGQISGIIGEKNSGDVDVERAIKLAPNNTSYRLLAGIYYLQSGETVAASPHFRQYLELLPLEFKSVIDLLKGKFSRRLELASNQQIYSAIIPDNPEMLFRFATDYLADDPEIKQKVLIKANDLLADLSFARVDELLLRSEIRLAMGSQDAAIEDMLAALKSNPSDGKTQYKVAKLLMEKRELDRALEEAKKLLRLNRSDLAYNALIDEIEREIRLRKINEQ